MTSTELIANHYQLMTRGVTPESSIWDSLKSVYSINTGAVMKVETDKKIPCHAKMEGKERPYAEGFKAKLEQARKLGLNNEVSALEKELLQEDIKELTKGAGYVEVTDKDLEVMFEFPRLRSKLRWHNFKCRYIPFSGLEQSDQIRVRLVKDEIRNARVRIPYGAQLRMEEAKDKGIFESFQAVYPNVVTEHQMARERDPALVGLYNGAMFLICSWDLPEDIAKADADVEALKALKLK